MLAASPTIFSHMQPPCVVDISSFILKVRKQRTTEAKWFRQGHTAYKRWRLGKIVFHHGLPTYGNTKTKIS